MALSCHWPHVSCVCLLGVVLLVLLSSTKQTVSSVELLQPITTSGEWLSGPAIPIDKAHRTAMAHKGVWLHVTTSDGAILVLRRSQHMATCPDLLSIIGEHHKGIETDSSCAKRAIHEELPALESLSADVLEFQPLRSASRWFLCAPLVSTTPSLC